MKQTTNYKNVKIHFFTKQQTRTTLKKVKLIEAQQQEDWSITFK